MIWAKFPAFRVLITLLTFQMVHFWLGASIACTTLLVYCATTCFFSKTIFTPTIWLLIGLAFLVRLEHKPKNNLPLNHYKIEKIIQHNHHEFKAYLQGNQKVLLSIKNLPRFEAGKYFTNDIIHLTTTLAPLPTKSYNGFNYGEYLQSQGVQKIAYLDNQLPVLAYRNPYNIQYLAEVFRFNLTERIIQLNACEPNTLGIVLSLTLGDKSFLKRDTKTLFRTTGVVHVLAISGLHVGILFLSLQFIFLKILRFNKKTACFFISFCLIFYTFLSGLSSSVLRASLMFIIIQFGLAFLNKPNTLNTIFASAILLLFYNPTYLFDIGFQLSYAAAIGIVILLSYSFLNYNVKNKILQSIWNLFRVNLGAFSFTAPVLIYHFSLINLTSFWASFIVVPLISIILYGCLLALIALPYAPVATVIFKGLNYVLGGLLELLAFIDTYLSAAFSINLNLPLAIAFAALLIAFFLRRFEPIIIGTFVLIATIFV